MVGGAKERKTFEKDREVTKERMNEKTASNYSFIVTRIIDLERGL